MPRKFLCDQCREVIDEAYDDYIIHHEDDPVLKRRLHVKCVEAYQKRHPEEFAD
jgi:hypothetical protein